MLELWQHINHNPTKALTSMKRALTAIFTTATLALTGCTAAHASADTLTLADTQNPGKYNPLTGYGNLGIGPIYDALYEPRAAGEATELQPILATDWAKPNDTNTTFTLHTRDGITFTDGTNLTASDIAATYNAAINPTVASDYATDLTMLDRAEATDDHTVVFHLNTANHDFPKLLTIGIAPAHSIETDKAATEWALNSHPIGTGSYILSKLTADTAKFTLRPNPWTDVPQLKNITVLTVPDDNARIQRLTAGDFDGTIIPPRQMTTLHDQGMTTWSAETADWRGLSFPEQHPFLGDRTVRQALNWAIDRDKLRTEVLAGTGQTTSFPGPDRTPDLPTTNIFDYNPTKAADLLTKAGYPANQDGKRAGAQFTLVYPVGDSLRQDIAQNIADQLAHLGVTAKLTAASWDVIETTHLHHDAVVLAGGTNPFSVDAQLYNTLHSRTDTSPSFANPRGATSPKVDTILDTARTSGSDYTGLAEAYRNDPSYLTVARISHTYAGRVEHWNTPHPILEPHAHGVTWGPFWNFDQWTRK